MATERTDPTFEELSETIARYSDPDDKLTIALGNFNRVRSERDALLSELARTQEALRDFIAADGSVKGDKVAAYDRLAALAEGSAAREAPRCTEDCDRAFHESCEAHGVNARPDLWGSVAREDKPTLCECGRADGLDDRGFCGYCIEEQDAAREDER
jgi:hypothetical protein